MAKLKPARFKVRLQDRIDMAEKEIVVKLVNRIKLLVHSIFVVIAVIAALCLHSFQKSRDAI